MIDQSTIDNGYIRLSVEDAAGYKEVNDYNEQALACRCKMTPINRTKDVMLGFTPLIFFCVSYAAFGIVFDRAWLTILILLINFVAMYLSYNLNNYIIMALASALLIFTHYAFAILFVANLGFAIAIFILERPLKPKPGYPKFKKIEVFFEEDKPVR